MNKALAGLVVALMLGAGLAVGVFAGGIISPEATPEPVAIASTSPSPSPTPSPTPRSHPRRRLSPAPRRRRAPPPSRRRPSSPAPLTGRWSAGGRGAATSIAVMIDDLSAARPQSGLNSPRVVWQAPAEGGIPRYMALFQDGSPTAVGPVRSSRYYFIAWAGGVARALRPRRRLAAGARAAALVEGQGPARLQRRRVPLGPLPLAGQHPVRPAQRVHGRRSTCGRWPRRSGRRRDYKPRLEVRPGRAARAAAEGRLDRRPVPGQHGSPTSTTG